MHQMREDLDIIFRKTLPEKALKKMHMDTDKSILLYPRKDYLHTAYGVLTEYSEDELTYKYKMIADSSDEHGIFSLLYQYADKILTTRDGNIAVQMECILGWNSISKRLGQDLFTTAWLAYRACNNFATEKRHRFTWPAVIQTDDVKLNVLLRRGTAENHFHLNGSTQSFALSWASLMNHPDQIEAFLKIRNNFEVNRNFNISRGIDDNVLSWKERICYAAMIRALLFKKMVDGSDTDDLKDTKESFEAFCRMPLVNRIQILVTSLRRIYGIRIKQPDKTEKCLDYAMSKSFYDVQAESDNRLLSGERAFLYNCFFRIYQNNKESRLSLYEQKMFYMYLLIKHQFRSELIQINQGVGFNNFSEYQNRKNQLFDKYDEYNAEAQRLAVTAAQKENHIKSFETRIMVLQSQGDLKKYIKILDEQIRFSDEQSDNYYVLHFPKKAFTEQELRESFSANARPRNALTRAKAERGARELRKYIMWEQGQESQRVYGIDACSNENGCRPETFATEFRYLRKISEFRYEIPWYRTAVDRYEELGITYHAGEDFMDITDGIRAIDEAIIFLELRKNDRLGHAIALGINPEDYYAKKNYSVCQSLQDCLDDIIWLLYRSVEWNVSISADKREKLRKKAREYFDMLYGKHLKKIAAMRSSDILDTYYESWQLRGDHPAQYKSGKFEPVRKFRMDPYEIFMVGERDKKHLQKLREDELTAFLYYLYHYDTDVKRVALKAVKFSVEKWYIELVADMQKALRKIIAERKIAVECNPTSNVLISNFQYYVKHPAMVFNHYRLDGNIEEPNLWISLNTDDIGVFDTSLGNEYALLCAAIIRCRHEEGNWNDEAVYEYLEGLRQNGLEMAFRDK